MDELINDAKNFIQGITPTPPPPGPVVPHMPPVAPTVDCFSTNDVPTPPEPITPSVDTTPHQPVPDTSVAPEVDENPINLSPNVTSARLDAWCAAGIAMEGADPANNNPGNIRFLPGTWMAKDAIGQHNGFCVFKDYQTGYNVLRQFFINAATGRSKIYSPEDTLVTFYSKYAPSSDDNNPDSYAQFVAQKIGVGVNTKIKYLI